MKLLHLLLIIAVGFGLSLQFLHCVSEKNDTSKNDTDVTYYRFNPHQPISVIFGRDVAEGVCY